ncbi:heme exporter protein CcmD [Pelagibacterium lacus]|uniref:Heme exporter protein D n=1 Tax=Pelagibacterium lacus TaxID=2282655 RepID=A0A369W5L2_9HYPH|nr:heme exporter protein CcmD [Pelagibacterium lacus]RDE09633.1 heme exporter protein CcmD [Pelagibacterium lacus]
MIDLGQHWEFIAATYAGSVLVIGALIGWTWSASRRARTRVARLEAARKARKA